MTRRADPDPLRPRVERAMEDAARQAMVTSTALGLAVALVHQGRVARAAAEVLAPLGMTASSFGWQRTAATAFPHDAAGTRIPDFAFAEQAAAGLVTTAPDLARFLAAALPGPRGEPPGRGVLNPAGVRLALTPAPATSGRWGLGYGLGRLAGGDRLAYHDGANRGWRAGLALLPERRAGIVALANSDGGSAPIDAVVQQ